ncbi:isocitrate/isopropylmalate dehydrogenase family protein, partial [candidate division KSB1 bacterium]
MNAYTIVTMPGDGIGKIVLPEAIRILDAVGFKATYLEAPIGWSFWCREGNPLPDRTIELLRQHKLGLFGAITSKPKKEALEELASDLSGKGLAYFSPIVKMRQLFDLDISIRPCKTFPGNPLNFIKRDAHGGIFAPSIDAVIFRQNTEGLYCGVEWTNPPDQVRAALETHPKMAAFKNTASADLAISTRIFSRSACQRICQAAFAYAQSHRYRSVTVCEKPNVIRET